MKPGQCHICQSTASVSIRTGTWQIVGVGETRVSFDICKACGHIGQFSPVPLEKMKKVYEDFSNYQLLDPNYKPAVTPPPNTARLIRIAEDLWSPPARIYEVGCANGRHLYHFKKAGWQVRGCEPSSFVTRQAREYHNIEVDVGTDEDLLPGIRDIDVLMFSHVIEHLYDPVVTLKRAKQCLSPEGHILIEVPCAIRPDVLPPGWFAFEHLSYFSTGTVQNLLAQAGLAPVEMFMTTTSELLPVITILAAPTDRETPLFNYFENSLQICEEYNTLDHAAWSQHNKTIRNSTKDVFVWGAGVHTAQLFDETDLLEIRNVVGVIDSDHQKWGKKQGNLDIISPDEFVKTSSDNSIIISSRFAEEPITKTLLGMGIPRGQIITLYSDLWEIRSSN